MPLTVSHQTQLSPRCLGPLRPSQPPPAFSWPASSQTELLPNLRTYLSLFLPCSCCSSCLDICLPLSPIKILPIFQHHVSLLHPQRMELTFSWSLQQEGLHIASVELFLLMCPVYLMLYLCQCLSHSPYYVVSSLRARNRSLICGSWKPWTQFPAHRRFLATIGRWEFLNLWFETIDSPLIDVFKFHSLNDIVEEVWKS